MSAPLVVNTRDGVCWTRRTVTRSGIALYAPESVKTCPDFVMATEAELAEHGIVGSAYALPMPVAPEPQEPASSKVVRIVAEVSGTESLGDAQYAESRVEYALEEYGYEAQVWIDSGGEQAELSALRSRVAELEAAAKEIQRLHTDSPMGPCPVCIDGDAMVRGDDYTLPYPCPTARLAGAKDCDPPSYVSRPLPPRDAVCARPGCGHPGVEHHHGDTRCWARLPKPLGAPVTNCDCTSFVAETGGAG